MKTYDLYFVRGVNMYVFNNLYAVSTKDNVARLISQKILTIMAARQ